MGIELTVNGVIAAMVSGVPSLSVLRYHIIAMLIGQRLTSFFAVWTVHHDCDRYHYIARTIRSRVGSFFTFNMFYHDVLSRRASPPSEVPTCNLPELAARSDCHAPELQYVRIFSRESRQTAERKRRAVRRALVRCERRDF